MHFTKQNWSRSLTIVLLLTMLSLTKMVSAQAHQGFYVTNSNDTVYCEILSTSENFLQVRREGEKRPIMVKSNDIISAQDLVKNRRYILSYHETNKKRKKPRFFCLEDAGPMHLIPENELMFSASSGQSEISKFQIYNIYKEGVDTVYYYNADGLFNPKFADRLAHVKALFADDEIATKALEHDFNTKSNQKALNQLVKDYNLRYQEKQKGL